MSTTYRNVAFIKYKFLTSRDPDFLCAMSEQGTAGTVRLDQCLDSGNCAASPAPGQWELCG